MIKEYYLVDKNEQLKSVIEKILLNTDRAVLVVDKKKVLGVISEGDVLNSLMYKKNINATASSLMNKSFKFLKTKDFLAAKKIFKKHLCSLIPIVSPKMILKDVITLNEFLAKI